MAHPPVFFVPWQGWGPGTLAVPVPGAPLGFSPPGVAPPFGAPGYPPGAHPDRGPGYPPVALHPGSRVETAPQGAPGDGPHGPGREPPPEGVLAPAEGVLAPAPGAPGADIRCHGCGTLNPISREANFVWCSRCYSILLDARGPASGRAVAEGAASGAGGATPGAGELGSGAGGAAPAPVARRRGSDASDRAPLGSPGSPAGASSPERSAGGAGTGPESGEESAGAPPGGAPGPGPGRPPRQTSLRFDERLRQLSAFLDRVGGYPTWKGGQDGERRLAKWVLDVRREHRRGALPPEHAQLLEALPRWRWAGTSERQQQPFSRSLADLLGFVEEHGEFPKRDGKRPGERRLAWWAINQRQAFRKGTLGIDRVAALRAVPWWRWEGRCDVGGRGGAGEEGG